jgi:ATP-dependent phosphoenolpyruvate carboxykinase
MIILFYIIFKIVFYNDFFSLGIVSIVFSLRVDRMYDNKITWTDKYKDSESQEYQQLEHEAVRAVSRNILFFSKIVFGQKHSYNTVIELSN